jgi:polar amino acid transport system substrate-binding protein
MMPRIKRRAAMGVLMALLAGPAMADGVLQVGSYPSNPPYEFKNDSGTFEGFEVDLVNAVAAKLGMTVAITDLGFQALFAATASHRVDVAISSITITPARLQNQDFTQPYFDDGLALIAGPASHLKTMEDVRGATLGAIASSTGENWIKANSAALGITGDKSYDTAANMFLDTLNGRVDGSVNDKAGSLYAFKMMHGMRIVASMPADEHIGMMLGKNSPLTGKVNDAITALKQDGTVGKLYAKWFGVEAPADSTTVKVAPLPHAG